MLAQSLATDAIVLAREISGEHWLRLACFSPEAGHLDCLQRRSRRDPTHGTLLDLFDEAHLTLETRNQGRTWFVKESSTFQRRTGLGRSYETLDHACRFARILAGNPAPEETRAQVHALLLRALAAWETLARPDAVYFKSLYLLARLEGYPVRESWWNGLDSADRASVEAMLREPAATQSTPASDARRLIMALEAFVRHETDIRLEA